MRRGCSCGIPAAIPPAAAATIVDVAARAGVSKGLVSFVLNDRPGVAPATRRRILAAVDELGWRPNQTARALVHARAYAVGFVLARPAELLAVDPFFPAFIAGVESELSARQASLVLQVVPDLDAELHGLPPTRRRQPRRRRLPCRPARRRPAPADARRARPARGHAGSPRRPAPLPGRRPRRRRRRRRQRRTPRGASVTAASRFVGGPDPFLHARNRRQAWRATLRRLDLRDDLTIDGDFSGRVAPRRPPGCCAAAPRSRPPPSSTPTT